MSLSKEEVAQLTIFNPTVAQATALRDLERKAFPDAFGSPVKSWSFEVNRAPLRTDVIVFEDQLIGLCYVRMVWPDMFNQLKRQYGEVALLAVAEDFHRLGVGERLLRSGVKKLVDNDAESVILQTEPGNLAMRRLAEKTRFTFDQELNDYYGFGQPAIQYRLRPGRLL